MKILTFDIAIKTGWCFGTIGGKLVGGTQRHAPSGSDHGYLFSKAMVWVADQITLYRPDRLAIEFNQNTITGKQQRGQTTIDVIMVHCGMRALILAVANEMGVQTRIVPYTDAAKAFIGPNKIKLAGDDTKEPVKRECRIRGLEFVDDNHSDAIARMRMRDPALAGAA